MKKRSTLFAVAALACCGIASARLMDQSDQAKPLSSIGNENFGTGGGMPLNKAKKPSVNIDIGASSDGIKFKRGGTIDLGKKLLGLKELKGNKAENDVTPIGLTQQIAVALMRPIDVGSLHHAHHGAGGAMLLINAQTILKPVPVVDKFAAALVHPAYIENAGAAKSSKPQVTMTGREKMRTAGQNALGNTLTAKKATSGSRVNPRAASHDRERGSVSSLLAGKFATDRDQAGHSRYC